MGRSELDWRFGADLYSFSEQAFGIAELVQAVVPDRPVVLIGHELGAMMAAQFAREHPSSVAGLVFVEGAFRVSNDTKFDPDVREFLGRVRSEEGKSMILRENLLVKFYLNRLTFRHLGPEELRGYGDPYARSSRSRQAMLSMIRQLPLRSDPGPINDLADQVRSWCQRSTIPKLVVGGKPGFLVPPAILATTARWTNTRTTSVRGLHFLTEDSPARITSTILDWLNHIGHMPPSRDSGDERTDAVEVSPYLQ